MPRSKQMFSSSVMVDVKLSEKTIAEINALRYSYGLPDTTSIDGVLAHHFRVRKKELADVYRKGALYGSNYNVGAAELAKALKLARSRL